MGLTDSVAVPTPRAPSHCIYTENDELGHARAGLSGNNFIYFSLAIQLGKSSANCLLTISRELKCLNIVMVW